MLVLATHRRAVRRELATLGIRKSRGADAPVWILVALLLLTAGAAAGAAATRSVSGEVAVALAAVGVTLAGLLVAVLQWRAGLAEKAFDALYGRIAMANDMWLKAREGLGTDTDADTRRTQAQELYRFYVFTEIDSLEYAIRRYRFGLGMNEDIAERAVRHFKDRCQRSTRFVEEAQDCADKGAYFDETKETVKSILGEVRR